MRSSVAAVGLSARKRQDWHGWCFSGETTYSAALAILHMILYSKSFDCVICFEQYLSPHGYWPE